LQGSKNIALACSTNPGLVQKIKTCEEKKGDGIKNRRFVRALPLRKFSNARKNILSFIAIDWVGGRARHRSLRERKDSDI